MITFKVHTQSIGTYVSCNRMLLTKYAELYIFKLMKFQGSIPPFFVSTNTERN